MNISDLVKRMLYLRWFILRKTSGIISYHCKRLTNDIEKLLSLLKIPDQFSKLMTRPTGQKDVWMAQSNKCMLYVTSRKNSLTGIWILFEFLRWWHVTRWIAMSHHSSMMSNDPSPAKRQKTEQGLFASQDSLPHLTLTSLLLSLPCLLLHPPTHTNHQRSLALSYHALKKCTIMTSLDRAVECRAATGLAELGLQIGLSSPGIKAEIQKAITKGVSGLILALNHANRHIFFSH